MALAVLLVLAGAAPGARAAADPVGQAQQRASAARARVDALLQRYQDANQQVDDGVRALSGAFGAAAGAEVTRDEARAQAERARARQSAQVHEVYASGGPAGVTASVLGATSPDDALWRASTADRVIGVLLADSRRDSQRRQAAAALAARRAQQAQAATQAQAAALQQLQAAAGRARTALVAAQGTLEELDGLAKQAAAARESARQIAAARAAAAAGRRAAMGPVTAMAIPETFEHAYRAAAGTCAGLPWTLLAAVGQVESGHGRANGPSSAGAVGPMQFLPATFAAYAVDGDADGTADPWDPPDAIFTAAHYLCVSGADGGSAAGTHAALLAYNHAEWYVDLVLAVQQAILSREADRP